MNTASVCFSLLLSALLLAACSSEDPADSSEAAADTDSGEPAVEVVSEPEPEPEPEPAPPRDETEVVVVQGLESVTGYLESIDWWGPEERGVQLEVPYMMITGIHPSWKEASAQIPVAQKKELFYRLMLPLVMHANKMVMTFRNDLLSAQKEFAANGRISDANLATVRRVGLLLPDATEEAAATLPADHESMAEILDALIYRVDIIPAGLALGQAAYESGYGTSRFAIEGNSLFGQWTYKGDGIKPKEQRTSTKGDHRIKAFEWPFDSVRGYFINLMSHPAYEDFRRLRAEKRAAGEPLDSMTLANGLLRYSERGKEYVDSLKGIMRVNKLDVADDAVFRDEPMRFMVSEQTAEDVENTRAEIERMRDTGELTAIIERMRLE